ncbi:MAG: hypothetical protein ACI4RA_09525 [Kiritimatiellia bacterium]
MKTRVVQCLFILLCTVLTAALQDMLPAFGGVKPPLLLALTLHWAFTEELPDARDRTAEQTSPFAVRWAFAALLAGACEDALSEFPVGCATGFLLLAGVAARLLRTEADGLHPATLGLIATMAAAPLHEVWLAVWGVAGDDPGLVIRFFASTLPAAPTGALVFLALPFVERHVGFNGPDAEGRIA